MAAVGPRPPHVCGTVPGGAQGAEGAAPPDLDLRHRRDWVRGLRLPDLGSLHLPAAQRAAVRATRARSRVPVRPAGREHPVVIRYGKRVAHVVLAGATLWAVAGLTILPIVTGRVDLQGAMCLPIFAYFVLRSPRWALFSAIFIATGELEIVGTTLGNWAWVPVAPWTHIPSGNPPSVIAGGYCVIDASVLLAMRGMSALRAEVPGYRVGLKTIMASITSTITPRA